MKIWEAYNNKAFYNVYFDVLAAKGMSRTHANELRRQFTMYTSRIKDSIFARDVEGCTTKEDFSDKLYEIFEVKWKGWIQYKEMPHHFYAFLSFLDSMQALHNDYISPEEKERLLSIEYPMKQLTHYETEYLVSGKIVALMNPLLLSLLKDTIEKDGLQPSKGTSLCMAFYGDLLPNMTVSDYKKLLERTWNKSRKVTQGGKANKFKLIFPGEEPAIMSTLDGLKHLVVYYGVERVLRVRPQIRGEQLVVKRLPFGKEKLYEEFDGGYILINGNLEDRRRVFNLINASFGRKVGMEVVK